MYVAPDTNLIFIKNCPLASNLEHTILFESAGAQQAYFAGLSSQTVDKYSFQRATLGVVRVGIPWNDCIGFNYLAFQNHAHGDKWFYAFITNYEYVNEGCTAVFFQIDVLQTYMFDWSLGECLIERWTTPTDQVGEYLLPEGLETGDPVIHSSSATYFPLIWLIGSTANLKDSSFPDVPLNASVYDNHALSYQIYACTGISFVNNVLSALVDAGKISAVQFLYPFPREFVTLVGDSASALGVWGVNINSNVVSLGSIALPDDLDGYTPKNNKMFTSPYTFARVVSSSGGVGAYRFEYSETPGVRLTAETSITPSSNIRVYPLQYNGMAKNYLETCVLNGLPLGAFNYDVFADWYSRNANREELDWKRTERQFAASTVLGGTMIVAGIATGLAAPELATEYGAQFRQAFPGITQQQATDMVGKLGQVTAQNGSGLTSTAVSSYNKLRDKVAAYQDMQIAPPATTMGASAGDANLAHSTYGFLLQSVTIRQEYAKTIDDFFSRYGYRVMSNETPTLQNRSNWDFIKTVDTSIGGNVPAIALAEIRAAFEKGITFWHSASSFGDYSQTNSPIG